VIAAFAKLSRISGIVRNRRVGNEDHRDALLVGNAAREKPPMRAFIRRFLMHYGIYRRYPLGRLPALRNAWRTARV
jgi:hypothetical protein